jgi:23S rRNA (cytidine1920-2'-O)/16S rRNA (cytidine1409-2'-O)-methyltransferase
MAGAVRVDGEKVIKPGTAVTRNVSIEIAESPPYASRGGFKLAGALDAFGISVLGRLCADIGACTGGFTDVLLQRGAARVYAIDVGYGQLDWKLRQNPKVVVMERTNARYLESLPEPIDLVSIDVSFISLKLILPPVKSWIAANGQIVALVKPQFEAGPEKVGKGGIVRDNAVHREVLSNLLSWSSAHGFRVAGLVRSPITGTSGNIEFFTWLGMDPGNSIDIDLAIQNVVG